MAEIKAPYKYDVVGSFLRPEELKKARADYEHGVIAREALKAAEDKAILELVAKEKQAGSASMGNIHLWITSGLSER